MKRIAVLWLASLLLLGNFFISASAVSYESSPTSSEMIPLLNNGIAVEADFSIDENGQAYLAVCYFGISGICREVAVTAQIYWRTSENDGWTITENEWRLTSDKARDDLFCRFTATKGGLYKAIVRVAFSGSGGADDTVLCEIERKYTPIVMEDLSTTPEAPIEQPATDPHAHNVVYNGDCTLDCPHFGCTGEAMYENVPTGWHVYHEPVRYTTYVGEDGRYWHQEYKRCVQCGMDVCIGDVICDYYTGCCTGGCQADK